MQETPININQEPNLIDRALDMLTTEAPKKGERLLEFVGRCTKCVPSKKHRDQLTRAILDTLIEAGFKALGPADEAQQFLAAMPEAAA